MDVSLNNVLESTRQYFQGVPSGVGGGAGGGGPPVGAAPLQPHTASGFQPNPPVPTSSPYWPGGTRGQFKGPHEPTEPNRLPPLAPFSTLNFRGVGGGGSGGGSSLPATSQIKADYPQYESSRVGVQNQLQGYSYPGVSGGIHQQQQPPQHQTHQLQHQHHHHHQQQQPQQHVPSPLPNNSLVHSPLPNNNHVHSPLPNNSHVHTSMPNNNHVPSPLPNNSHVHPPLPNNSHVHSPLPNNNHVHSPMSNSNHVQSPMPINNHVHSPLANNSHSLHPSVQQTNHVQLHQQQQEHHRQQHDEQLSSRRSYFTLSPNRRVASTTVVNSNAAINGNGNTGNGTHRSILSGVVKRESPLDLSVKTVRQSADSTAKDDHEHTFNNFPFQGHEMLQFGTKSRVSQQLHAGGAVSNANGHSSSLNSTAVFEPPRNSQLLPLTGVPKVDFHPDFRQQRLQAVSHNYREDTSKQLKPGQHQHRPQQQMLRQQIHPQQRTLPEQHRNQNQPQQRQQLPQHSMPQYFSSANPLPSAMTFTKSSNSSSAAFNSHSYYQTPTPVQRHSTTTLPPTYSPSQYPYDSTKQPVDKRHSEYDNKAPNHALEPSYQLGKRPSPSPSQRPLLPPKLPRVDNWRQSIDQQIEKKFISYLSSKDTINGNASPSKSPGLAQQHHGQITVPTSRSSQSPMNNHMQFKPPNTTMAPSVSYHSTNMQYLGQYPQTTLKPRQVPVNSVADKRVLSILRNNLEAKNQLHNKIQQRPPTENTFHSFEPKINSNQSCYGSHNNNYHNLVAKNSLPPFGAIAVDRNAVAPPFHNHKLHLPKAIDSVCQETLLPPQTAPSVQEIVDITGDDDETKESKMDLVQNGVLQSGIEPNLAAFLAARIRTKAELKQVDSSELPGSGTNQIDNFPLHPNSETTPKDLIKLGVDETVLSSTSGSKTSGWNVSPPKLTKEPNGNSAPMLPRRRLFSRSDDEAPASENTEIKTSEGVTMPPRDPTGLRSSSETSVFDFRDSESESEMPVLERQTLHEMRKDRKQPRHHENEAHKKESDHSLWNETCEQLLIQLQNGSAEKRSRRGCRKKTSVERSMKIEILEDDSVKDDINCDIKEEVEECNVNIPKEEELSEEDIPLEQRDISLDTDLSEDDEESEVISNASSSDDGSSSSDYEGVNEISMVKRLRLRKPTTRSRMKLREREPVAPPKKVRKTVKKKKAIKTNYGDGTDFIPGWEEELYRYKISLRMPPRLINITRPPGWPRGALSLPDLERLPDSPMTLDSVDFGQSKGKGDNDMDSAGNKRTDDNKSKAKLMQSLGEEKSFLDRLMQKYCSRKKKALKNHGLENKAKIIPRVAIGPELLPTPTLDEHSKVKSGKELNSLSKLTRKKSAKEADKIKTDCDIKDSVYLGYFRKETVAEFREAFVKHNNGFAGENDLPPVVLHTRTRMETKVMQHRATIKEVFGAERPASAPPVSFSDRVKYNMRSGNRTLKHSASVVRSKKALRNSKKQLIQGEKHRRRNRDLLNAYKLRRSKETDNIPALRTEKRLKLRTIRRKLKSSGFDYIRKKKKQQQKRDGSELPKEKRKIPHKATPMSEQEILSEIKGWVINKGLGETLLHRAARLGYVDIVEYCLKKLHHNPSPRDNAGYTPLHEACSRGHIDIARLLLSYGANVSEGALGGVRPLHEAAENGFTELIKVLLDYGADPQLATYAGQTALSLATEEEANNLMQLHITKHLNIKSSIFTEGACGSEMFELLGADADQADKVDGFEIEESDQILPNLYRLSGEPRSDSWVLFHELAPLVHIKTREALLKQLGQDARTVLRDMKLSEFYAKAHCRTIKADPKLNPKVAKVTLVKYSDTVKFLLGVETTVIPR